MRTIFQALAELETKNEPAALCTVVRASGSTPRHATGKLLVDNPKLEWQPQWGFNQRSRIVR